MWGGAATQSLVWFGFFFLLSSLWARLLHGQTRWQLVLLQVLSERWCAVIQEHNSAAPLRPKRKQDHGRTWARTYYTAKGGACAQSANYEQKKKKIEKPKDRVKQRYLSVTSGEDRSKNSYTENNNNNNHTIEHMLATVEMQTAVRPLAIRWQGMCMCLQTTAL